MTTLDDYLQRKRAEDPDFDERLVLASETLANGEWIATLESRVSDLEAENKRLRKALKRIADRNDVGIVWGDSDTDWANFRCHRCDARIKWALAALQPPKEK